ncbi:MAG TPA: serine hydrolase [Rubrobacteraceae bacterium]|nr:serine hydrolase [Rubrobacteraceae bacterium]
MDRKKRSFSRGKARRQRIKALVLLAAVLLASLAAYFSVRSLDRSAAPEDGLTKDDPYTRLAQEPFTFRTSAPDPPELTLAGYAYKSVAPELPGIEPDSVRYPQQSVLEPTWASVRVAAPGHEPDDYYAVFLQKDRKEWRAKKSVLIEDQEFPKDVKTLLGGIPQDLVDPLFAPKKPEKKSEDPAERAVQVMERATGEEDWRSLETKNAGPYHRVSVGRKADEDVRTNVYLSGLGDALAVVGIGEKLTSVEAPGFPPDLVKSAVMAAPDAARISPAEPVYDGAVDRERIEPGMTEARRVVEDYSGTVGFYALDLKSGAGYGVRPDEPFFSASTIKLPVMVAVYRRIDEGELAYDDVFQTTEEDWAAGAGWLRWDTPGATTTIEDALWLMITQSDNVATNALVRKVGGPEYVNEVARSLGARDTVLFTKLSSERAAVPSLDNQTTPKDMALMLEEITSKNAASDFACEEMLGLMRQNNLEYWMEAGVPEGIPVANKAGWLDATYNDVGFVEYEDGPYILATFTKYGEKKMEQGAQPLQNISKAVWLAQSGKTVEQYEREKEEKLKEKLEKQRREAEGRQRQDQNGTPRERP